MARIKYSALVDNIRGSIAGTTFQNNRYGYTVKTKPQLVNRNTSSQVLQKRDMSVVARAWRNLTEANRTNWDTYAETNPRPTKKNLDAYLSGYNYFLLVNRYRVLASQSIMAEPSFTLQQSGAIDYILYNDGGVLSWETNPTDMTGLWRALLFLTNVIPFGREYVNATPRFITAVAYNAGALTNITALYNDRVGTVPPVGQYVGMRVVLICDTTGQVIEGGIQQIQLIATP